MRKDGRLIGQSRQSRDHVLSSQHQISVSADKNSQEVCACTSNGILHTFASEAKVSTGYLEC